MQQRGTDRTVLKREMGLISAVVIVVANMIGTGIFTTSGFIMKSLGDTYLLLICWLMGGVLALCGALCFGELGAMFPKAGGEYVFLRESYGGLMSFLSGWISLIVGFSAPIAAASMAFASYLFRSLPESAAIRSSQSLMDLWVLSIFPSTLVAIGIIVIFSLIHTYGLYFGSRVQNILTVFKVAVISVFIIIGMVWGNGSMNNFVSSVNLEPLFSDNFAVSLIFVSFAYSGWNAAAYLGEEIKSPSRNIPLALFWGTFFVIVLYLFLNIVFLYALPAQEISGVLEVGAASALTLFGPGVGNLFSLAITVCLLSVISAMIMAGPRVYYAMARDGAFFGLFGTVSRSTRTPAASICLQAAIAIVMVLTSSFNKLLLYIGFTLSVFAMLTVLGLVILRRKMPHVRRDYKTFGYPVTPFIFILGNLWIIFFAMKNNLAVSLYGGGTIAAGILVYLYFNRCFISGKLQGLKARKVL